MFHKPCPASSRERSRPGPGQDSSGQPLRSQPGPRATAAPERTAPSTGSSWSEVRRHLRADPARASGERSTSLTAASPAFGPPPFRTAPRLPWLRARPPGGLWAGGAGAQVGRACPSGHQPAPTAAKQVLAQPAPAAGSKLCLLRSGDAVAHACLHRESHQKNRAPVPPATPGCPCSL